MTTLLPVKAEWDNVTSAGNTAITFLSICNFNTANVLANVHVVLAGQIASNNNIILSSLTLTSQNTYQLYSAGGKNCC